MWSLDVWACDDDDDDDNDEDDDDDDAGNEQKSKFDSSQFSSLRRYPKA